MEFVFTCYISSSVVILADLFLSVFEGCVGVYNRGVNRARIYAQLLISAQLRLRRLTHSVLLWRCEAYSLALCSVSILFVSLCYESKGNLTLEQPCLMKHSNPPVSS